ncbi:MAG: hypothetical protein H6Q43_2664 [Deltaproteobacteria bacterium]|nr:hypothetical protein [Deltaproteobacteria bacterium]
MIIAFSERWAWLDHSLRGGIRPLQKIFGKRVEAIRENGR